jgi:hypothetical protein
VAEQDDDEDRRRHEAGGPEADEQQRRAEHRPGERADLAGHREQAERLAAVQARPGRPGGARQLGLDRGGEHRRGHAGEQGTGDDAGRARRRPEEHEADHAHGAAGEHEGARTEPVREDPADHEEPLLAGGAQPQDEGHRSGGQGQVAREVHREEGEHEVEAGVEGELAEHEQAHQRAGAAQQVQARHENHPHL